MLAYPIATVAFLLLSQDAVATTGTKKTPTKTDFLRAMNQHSTRRKLSNDAKKEFHAELYGSTKKSAALRKKIMDRSTITKVPGDESAADPELKSKADEGRRKLEQNYNKYNQYNDATDDYYHASGGYENIFGFDPTQFSVSYHRCATVKQFDDELAATEDSETVFAEKHFAVFRFCPEQTCQGWQMDYEKCGCERQCKKAINQGYTYNNNNDDGGGDDEENCLSACYDSCKVWSKQQQLNSNYSGRKLEDDNMSGWYNGVYYNKNPWASHDFDPYFNGEDNEVWGARGQGCQSNYGEYMIELEDYLQIMLEYQGERYEEYVEYCENCMQQVYQKWMNSYHGRTLTYEEWKVSEHAEDPRNLAQHYNDDAQYANINYVCEEYDTCREYNQIAEVDEFSDYFECAEVERNNGQMAYVGPVCGSDGYDITLGVFTDEYCNVFIGDSVDVSNFVGQEVSDGTLRAYYDSAFGATLEQLEYVNEDQVCIPCSNSDLMWDVTMTNMNVNYEDVDDDQAQNNEDQEYDYDADVNELCTNLYTASARCDKHYRAYSSMSKNAKYAQAVAQEDLTCDFIDSVAVGNYGKDGFINVGNGYTVEKSSGWMGNSLYAQEYGHYITEVTPLQIFGLIASILAVGILAVWSATLHKSLSKGGPWKPRRGLRNASPEQPDLTRQNSGVMMGRSASNTSYYMS